MLNSAWNALFFSYFSYLKNVITIINTTLCLEKRELETVPLFTKVHVLDMMNLHIGDKKIANHLCVILANRKWRHGTLVW